QKNVCEFEMGESRDGRTRTSALTESQGNMRARQNQRYYFRIVKKLLSRAMLSGSGQRGQSDNKWKSTLKVVDKLVVRCRELASLSLGEGDVQTVVHPDSHR